MQSHTKCNYFHAVVCRDGFYFYIPSASKQNKIKSDFVKSIYSLKKKEKKQEKKQKKKMLITVQYSTNIMYQRVLKGTNCNKM